jgi:excinuclease UvrABC helicase subunit UvrB
MDESKYKPYPKDLFYLDTTARKYIIEKFDNPEQLAEMMSELHNLLMETPKDDEWKFNIRTKALDMLEQYSNGTFNLFPSIERPAPVTYTELDEAQGIINEYMQKELQHESADYSDLRKVQVAFTETEDGKHEIQVELNLVDFGFRLPAALDNRPLKFEEFQEMTNQVIYVSATPDDYELQESGGVIVEQLIRPTGLLDPIIEVRPSMNQVDDLMEEIEVRTRREERVLVTTLTKRMAEELTAYLQKHGVRCNYIHSDVDTLERVQIMTDLREGLYDVLIGVNLLREGLDLPEVSLVAILDADKEGFLRSHRSLTQTAGRAARNVNGKVIFYADNITSSMKKTMDETRRRREKQIAYNEANGITPQQIRKSIGNALTSVYKEGTRKAYDEESVNVRAVADPIVEYMSREQLEKSIERTRRLMKEAADKMEFIEAAQYRDEMMKLQELLDGKK